MSEGVERSQERSGAIRGAIGVVRRAVRRAIGASGGAELVDLRREVRALRDTTQGLSRQQKQLTKAFRLQSKRLGRTLQALQRINEQLGEKGLTMRARLLEQGMHAVIRRLYVDPAELTYPHALLVQRFGILSQNDEDGLTWALFRLIGVTDRRFVELGSGVNGGNSGFLASECGWTGLMVDGSDARIERVKTRFGPGVRAEARWITRESVNELVSEHGLAGEIDLLSIDIDGNEYWVWEALTVCNPRVVIVEYNAWFGPERAVTVPYDPQFDRHKFPDPRYYGSSLTALARLGARKGYRLVVTEPRGVNAYFLRQDVHPALQACEPGAVFRFNDTSRGGDFYASIAQHALPLIDVTI